MEPQLRVSSNRLEEMGLQLRNLGAWVQGVSVPLHHGDSVNLLFQVVNSVVNLLFQDFNLIFQVLDLQKHTVSVVGWPYCASVQM